VAADRVLPRNWDGRRLLRFLTGLALLALAFTFRVDAVTPAAPPSAVVSSAGVSRTAASPAAASAAPAPPPAAPSVTDLGRSAGVLTVPVVAAPDGLPARAYGSRAPPLA